MRFVVAALLVVAAAAAVGAYREGLDGATLTGASSGGPCRLGWEKAEHVGSLPGRRKEVSGFVASAGRRNLAWMAATRATRPPCTPSPSTRTGR